MTAEAATLVPPIVERAGPGAVESYLGFFAGATSHHSRSVFRAGTNAFLTWCEAAALDLDAIRPGHVADFFGSAHGRWKLSTVQAYFAASRRLFAHLESDRVIERSPFAANWRPRHEPDDLPPTLDSLKQLLYDLDGYTEASRCYRPGLVAMYPVVIGGFDEEEIARTTGLPIDEVRLYAGRLRDSGLWSEDGKVVLDPGDQDIAELTVNLVLIIGCAAGIFRRVPETDQMFAVEEDGGREENASPLPAAGDS